MTSPFSSWAQMSDTLVQSAIAVLALALLAYAADMAVRRRSHWGAVLTGVEPALSEAAAGVGAARTARHGHPVQPTSSGPVSGDLTDGFVETGRVGRTAGALTTVGVGMVVAAVVTRGIAAERAPWGNMYEFAITGAAAAGVAYLIFLARQPVRDLGIWVVGLVLLTLGLATTVLYTSVSDLVPVLESYWLVVHVAAAITAGGLFTVGFVATGLGLYHSLRHRDGSTWPGLDAVQRAGHTAVLIAFPIWTFAVMAGAIWAENAWGRYWGWDPKETWAFITWVFYAAYLHATATAGWRGRRAMLLALAGFLAFVFNFFGVNIWLPGLHSYAGV